MGPSGVRLHQAACGEDIVPLTPVDEPRRFVDRLDLEWPIDGLEPLSFVLARQCDRLSAALERADRGAIAITTDLRLVDKTTHRRGLQLPAPMRDARVLRTLIQLDLESHPPPAAIDVVEITLEVAPGHILQGSLLAHAVPVPEDLATLLARLGALMGEARVGAPVVLDTHDARQVALGPFRLRDRRAEVPEHRGAEAAGAASAASASSPFALRRFRLPIAVRVAAEQHTPLRIIASAPGVPAGPVVTCAGPWRTSGGWWSLDRTEWDRDEWDVELDGGVRCRLARHRGTGHWEIEGVFD
jgi:protein ImuB